MPPATLCHRGGRLNASHASVPAQQVALALNLPLPRGEPVGGEFCKRLGGMTNIEVNTPFRLRTSDFYIPCSTRLHRYASPQGYAQRCRRAKRCGQVFCGLTWLW